MDDLYSTNTKADIPIEENPFSLTECHDIGYIAVVTIKQRRYTMAKENIKVVGFSVYAYQKNDLNRMSDHEKYEAFLSDDENCASYDCIDDWFNDLNDDMIDTEGMFWFIVRGE